jgi:hypothetical protein
VTPRAAECHNAAVSCAGDFHFPKRESEFMSNNAGSNVTGRPGLLGIGFQPGDGGAVLLDVLLRSDTTCSEPWM